MGKWEIEYKSKLSCDTLSNVLGHGNSKPLFWNCPSDPSQYVPSLLNETLTVALAVGIWCEPNKTEASH